jgi:hypothetical protein
MLTSFKGSNVQLIGSTDFEWGRFYGFGNHWWDLGNQVGISTIPLSQAGPNIILDTPAIPSHVQRDEQFFFSSTSAALQQLISFDEGLMRNLKVSWRLLLIMCLAFR